MMETGDGSGGQRRVIGVEECKNLLHQHLIKSGNSELLKRLIKNRASQQGLTYSIRVKCFEYIKAKGIENVNVGKMLEEIVPIGFSEFPEEAKEELRSDLSDIAKEIVHIIPDMGAIKDFPPYQVQFAFNHDESSQSDSEPSQFIRHVLKKTKIRSRSRRKLKIIKSEDEEAIDPLSLEHSDLLQHSHSPPPLPMIDIVKKEFPSLGDEPMSLEKLLGPPIHQVKLEKEDPLDSYFDMKTETSPVSFDEIDEPRHRGKPSMSTSSYNIPVKIKSEKSKKRTFESTAMSIASTTGGTAGTTIQLTSSVPTKAALKKHQDDIDTKGIPGLKISQGVQQQNWSSESDDGMKSEQKYRERLEFGKGPSPRPPDLSSLQIDVPRGSQKGPRPSPPGKEIRGASISFNSTSPKGLSPSSNPKAGLVGKSQKKVTKVKAPPRPKPIMIAPIFEDEEEEEAEEDDLLDV